MTTNNYAIETIDLIKRYPTHKKSAQRGGGGHHDPSLGNLLEVTRKHKGPYLEALKGINLAIKKGESFGILGPNGAGKTTLLKILCTLIIHDEGEVYVNGYDVRKHPTEVLKNLQAILPESRGFTWRLSGRQNLEFYGLLYGLDEKESKKRVNYLLELTNLQDRADDGYQRYSTGMQRRLLLCRALLRDTPILLFDEPTTGLDPASAAEFRSLLHDKLAHGEGKTIVLSTHNLYEAQEMCDRIAILDRGKITACDTPDKIRHMVMEEKVLDITFTNNIAVDAQEKLLVELQGIAGVHVVIPATDAEKHFSGMSLRVEKNMDVSAILNMLTKSGLGIDIINTNVPTLEDAFMAITNHKRENTGGSER
jgi:ABC-2 type transport system ATP-binding protein